MYMPQLNSIVVPLGIQQPPIYRDQQLQVLTFGSLGFVVGHEFTHGFDNNGAKFDKEGNFRVSTKELWSRHLWTLKCIYGIVVQMPSLSNNDVNLDNDGFI